MLLFQETEMIVWANFSFYYGGEHYHFCNKLIRRYLILGGIFAHSFIALNGSAMQNRALKTSENAGHFSYGHPFCPPDGV